MSGVHGEDDAARAARERLTALLFLLAVAVGVVVGVVSGDVGLGIGAWIAAGLVGAMVLVRVRPDPDAGLPPRWAMVLSFVSGPLVAAAGVVGLVQGEVLVGGVRLACGLVSVAFACDQLRLRREPDRLRVEALRASLATPRPFGPEGVIARHRRAGGPPPR